MLTFLAKDNLPVLRLSFHSPGIPKELAQQLSWVLHHSTPDQLLPACIPPGKALQTGNSHGNLIK